ncbi:hypothetical protein IKF63_00455 [Candidatus Saccharibacteria bacterium]|nr:hypothetical protein [Candidatus Saccharibacteria bacterium]
MLVVSFLKWWYTRGFKDYFAKFVNLLKNAADFFSIRLLIRNFFSPFRQISAEKSSSLALGERLRAAGDYLLSCIIGAIIRFFILIIGIVIIFIQFIFGIIGAILWPLMPALLVYCFVLFARGVTF